MADYVRKPQIFLKRGMSISLPGDRLSPEWFQYVQNVRSYILGEWRQRPGTQQIFDVNEAIYYITRVNDNDSGTFRRFIGTVNGNIYIDDIAHTGFTLADSGYNGKQYSSVISRPDRATDPYLFVANSNRNGKFDPVGNRTDWGLIGPTTAPVVDGQGVDYAVITSPTNPALGVVISAGIATNTQRVVVPIQNIIYDLSNPGMGNVTLATFSIGDITTIGAGMLIDLIDNVTAAIIYTTVVQETFLPIASTTVAAIAYDSGVAGLCTIQLSGPTAGLRRNSIIQITATGEQVRVLSVTSSLSGVPSFRCSTVGTVVVGQAISGVFSIRCYLQGTFVFPPAGPNQTIVATNFIDWDNIPDGLQTITQTISLNLASADVFNGGLPAPRPIQDDDNFHLGLLIRFGAVDEVQIQFDVDNGDFATNYYFVSMRPSDLQGAIDQTTTSINAQQLDVQRTQLDEFVQQQAQLGTYSAEQITAIGELVDSLTNSLDQGLTSNSGLGPVSTPLQTGTFQWTDFFIPVSQFQRVGVSDQGWKDVVAWRITANVVDGGGAGTNIGIDTMWMGGTHGPDSSDIIPYTYVYRARNTDTGSRSNPSPPTKYATDVRRRLVRVDIPSYPDPQADVFDVYRFGGILTDYHLVGTTPSSVSTFQDDIPDSVAIRNPILETNQYKPWISTETPKSGICNTVGTTVLRQSGDLFSTQWIKGNQIIIGGNVYSLYTNPTSIDVLTLNESSGILTNVVWQIPEPTIEGQTLPSVFGPYSGSGSEFIFVVGDPRNPGYLYWTNGNQNESTSGRNILELCPPSETLMNGCVLDGIIYVFSDKRSWRILPSFNGGQTGGGSDFYPQETAMGKGLISRWALAIGDAIYFASYDGIYVSRGDAVESLTDEMLAPLFRRDGTITSFGAPLSPIDMTQPDEISLVYSYDGLYFHFMGVDGIRYTGYMSFLTKGWMFDNLSGDSMIRSYREIQSSSEDLVLIGTNGGSLLRRNNSVFTDNGQAISCRIWDREEIWDDPRLTKQVGDSMIDANPAGATITPTMRFEDNTSNEVLSTITGSVRNQFVRDLNSGAGRIVTGAALDLTWIDGTSGIPKVYAWEPAALIKAEESVNRASDWDNGGYTGTKWVQGFRLRGDTLGLAKSFQVQYDGGTTSESFSFTANGEQVQTFWLNDPIVAHEMRIIGLDDDLWRNMGVEWICEPEPEMAAVWETQVTSFDLQFFMHMREVMIAHRSTTDITMIVITDSNVSNSYVIPHGSGQRVRSYLPVMSIKSKYHKFRFISAQPFGLWLADIECKVGQWGRSDQYTTQRPFGDISRTNGGARI